MNGISAKKINSRPQNWISLINFVENRSKQKVRLPYCNLYAYAANNPVHYIDPSGAFYANFENMTITTDIDNKEDMRLTEKFMNNNEGFTCYALNKDGDGLVFQNIEGLKAYNKIDSSTDYVSTVENVLSALSNSTFVISEVGKNFAQLKRISNNLDNISIALGGLSVAVDIYQCFSDPNVSNFLDILITATGIIPGCGPYINTTLSSAKQGVCFASEQMAEYDRYLQKKFANEFTSFFFNFKVR